MKLLLRRNQKTGGLLGGKLTFTLDVRAELAEEEKANIQKYKMADTLLYSQKEFSGPTEGFKGLAAAIAFRVTNLSITVSDLEKGKQIECKDIVEMLGAEEQVKEAARAFKAILTASATFGGEEIVEI